MTGLAFIFFSGFSLLGPSDPFALLAAGDAAFARIDYPTALASYRDALKADSRDAETLWRLARVSVCMGEVAEDSTREGLFTAAEEYARRCIASDSTNAAGHTWLAGALGYTAYFAGSSQQVRLVHEVIAEARTAIRLDPRNDAAYSILGSTYRALGNTGWIQRQLASIFIGAIPEGGFEEGEIALRQAIALAPEVMRHRYELGVLYLDWGKKGEALQLLKEAAGMPVRVAIDRPRRVKTLELIQELAP